MMSDARAEQNDAWAGIWAKYPLELPGEAELPGEILKPQKHW